MTVEARYTVGEYDIAILSATQSNGLETWLQAERLPHPGGREQGAAALRAAEPQVLRRQGEPRGAGEDRLCLSAAAAVRVRIRALHAAGAAGHAQRQGPAGSGRLRADPQRPRRDHQLPHRASCPPNVELPTYTRGEFAAFYKALFDTQSKREDYRVVWTEYFWDMAWCDPCAADPLSPDELSGAGVFWLDGDDLRSACAGRSAEIAARRVGRATGACSRACICATRRETLPEDLCSRRRRTGRTSRRATCCAIPGRATPTPARKPNAYFDEVAERQEREAQTLARLTGWDINAVLRPDEHRRGNADTAWWERLWR